MKFLRWITFGALIAGALSGPIALDAGIAAQPPIEWRDIPFLFFGSLLGMLFVIGIQLFRRDSKPCLWALYFFAPTSLWLVTSGLSAVILAIIGGSVVPFVFMFLALGAGASLGVSACWLMFRWRFRNTL